MKTTYKLMAIVAVAIALTAGVSYFWASRSLGEKNDKINSLQVSINSKENRIASLESSVALKENKIASLEDTIENIRLKSVVHQNIEALNSEDLYKYVNTLHTESPLYESTGSTMGQLFQSYDVRAGIKNIKILGKSDRKGEVECVTIYVEVGGAEYRDHQSTLVHTLRKEDGEWKIYNSKVKETEYL